MNLSESDSESPWNVQIINAVRKKQRKGEIITEEYRRDEIAEALKQGANIDTVNKQGDTALHIAAKKDFRDVAKFLCQRGARTDICNSKGYTAITLAENLGRDNILRILRNSILQQSESVLGESTRASNVAFAPVNYRPSASQSSDDITQENHSRTNGNKTHVILGGDEHEPEKFTAGDTLTRSWPGIVYQWKQLAFTLQSALGQTKPYFYLATEMVAAEKLDDIVLLYENVNGELIGRFVQVKHGNDPNKMISAQNLLKPGGNFSVLNYFQSWRKLKDNLLFSKIESRNMILCTNIGLNVTDLDNNKISYVETKEPDVSFELKSRLKRTAWYKLVAEEDSNEKVYQALRSTSDTYQLATRFAECIRNKKPMRLEMDIFQYYHVALVNHVFNRQTKKFHKKFIKNDGLPPRVEKFRDIFVSEYKKLSEISLNDISEESVWTDVEKRLGEVENFRQGFGQGPKLVPDPQLTNVDELADLFVELLENADKKHIVKTVTKLQADIIADNIEKLSGHVLVEDDKKIKFSSKFLKGYDHLPGNIEEFRIALKEKVQNKCDLNAFEFEIQTYKVRTKRQLLPRDELPDDEVKDEEISSFLEEFTLAVNQPNDDEIDEVIMSKIGANWRFNMRNTKLLGATVQTEILKWFVKRGEREKQYISCKVGEKFLDELHQEVIAHRTVGVTWNHVEWIKARSLFFKSKMPLVVEFLTEETSHRILQLVAPEPDKTLLTALRVYDTLEHIPRYEMMDSFIFIRLENVEPLWMSKTVIPTFGTLQCPDLMVVDCGSSDIKKYSAEFWNPLCEIMAKDRSKRIILITQNEFQLITRNYSNAECPIISLIHHEQNDDYNFQNLTYDTRKKLLTKPVTQFQGYKTVKTFGDLLGICDTNRIDADELRDLSDIFDCSVLLELVCKAEIEICRDLGRSSESEHYINRTIRQVIIREDIFNDDQTSDLFAISGSNSELSSMFRDPVKFIILDQGQEQKHFRTMCERYTDRNIHWLKNDSGRYIWEKSVGDITRVSKYRATSGSENLYHYKPSFRNVHDLTCRFFHERTTRKGENNDDIAHATGLTMSENELVARDELVIISDTAGMGKSTMLTRLAWRLKENQPDMLVVKINLNHHVTALEEALGKSSDKVGDIDEVIEFLTDDLLGHETNLSRKVIRRIIRTRRNVALIFDGFDEISPNYEKIVLNLLRTLVKYGIKKLFVATRPHTRQTLERELETLSHEMKPFSTENQEEFLNKQWEAKICPGHGTEHKVKARISKYAKAVLKKLAESINDRSNGFTGNPLQIRLVADIFRNQTPANTESCEKFMYSNNDEPKLPGKMNLIYLYKQFVEKKFNVFFDKRRSQSADITVKRQKLEEFRKFIDAHRKLALDALFEKEKVKVFPSILDYPPITIEPNGIITHVDEHGRPQFGHRSYAEYFVAEFIVDKLSEGMLNEHARQIFVTDILLAENFQTTRTFINCFWAEEHERNIAFGTDFAEFPLNEHRGSLGRTIFHVAADEGNDQIIQTFLKYLANKSEDQQALTEAKDDLGNTAVLSAALSGCFHSLQLLVRHEVSSTGTCDNVKHSLPNGSNIFNSANYNDETPLHASAARGDLHVVKYLVDMGAHINSRTKDGDTPLSGAAHAGKAGILKYLVERGADVNSQTEDGETPLCCAAHNDEIEIVKYLVDKGANMHFRGKDGKMPLFYAVFAGKLNVVEYSVNEGADVNYKAERGQSPLHDAAMAGRLEVVEYLIKAGANVYSEDNYGLTPLHYAAYSGKLHAVEYLVMNGADVDSKDKKGVTPLHATAQAGELDVIEFLFEEGADINSETKERCTALHIAAETGKLDIVEYLAKRGADVLSQDKGGKTPLFYAAFGGQLHVVEYLVKEGANVNSEANDRETPLFRAGFNGHLHAVDYLVREGAIVDHKCAYQTSLLYQAAAAGKLDVVEYLIKKGADVDSKSKGSDTPLHESAYNGKLDIVKHLVEAGADINSKTDKGCTPLHAAVAAGKLDVAEYLARKGADVHSQDKNGETPLFYAACSGQLPVIEYLVKEGANVNHKCDDWSSPLHKAAGAGKLDVVEYLVTEGANVNAEAELGCTPLWYAAVNGKVEVMKFLVDNGADVNSETKDGQTLLLYAAANSTLNIVEYLVNKGAEVHAKTKCGMTPLQTALWAGNWEVVKYLSEKVADCNPESENGTMLLHEAAWAGDLEVTKYLVREGADVNSASEDGRTPLHEAAWAGDLEVVKYLVREEADVNSASEDGRTPLHEAAWAGDLEVVKYLVREGADVNSASEDGRTPLHEAASTGELEIVKYFIDNGANINSATKDGVTSVYGAAWAGEIEVVSYLVAKGANVDSKTEDGMTLLHEAAGAGKAEVIKYLVESGANVNSETKTGETPLHRAAMTGQLKIVEYLISQEASINSNTQDGVTPLHEAALAGEREVVRYLLNEGANVHYETEDGTTLLHEAAWAGELQVVKYLVQSGANVNSDTKNGETPLHRAAMTGQLAVVKYLIDEKANINSKMADGITPLREAASSDEWEVVKYLVEKGANVDSRTEH